MTDASGAQAPRRRLNARALDRHAKAPPAWEVLRGGRARLERLCRTLRLPSLGREMLFSALDSDPVFHPRATPKSSVLHVPSAKMQRILSAASRTVEYPVLHYFEYDPEVLLYLHQPLTVEIRIVDINGRRRAVPYTPDFLVVRADGVRAYQCKHIEELREQSGKLNSRYFYDDESAMWRHPAAEKAFARYGFTHHVVHSNDVNPRWLRNIRFLADYLAAPPPAGVDAAREALGRAVALTFPEACATPGTSRETWFWLIASGGAAFDLERDQLDRPDLRNLATIHASNAGVLCHRAALDSRPRGVAADALCRVGVVSLDPGDKVVYRDVEHKVVSRDSDQVVLVVSDPDPDRPQPSQLVLPLDAVDQLVNAQLLRPAVLDPEWLAARESRRVLFRATPAERERALRRWDAVLHYREHGAVPPGVSRSSLFNYLSWARKAAATPPGAEILGMFRRLDRRIGGRPLPLGQAALLEEVAAAFHEGKFSTRKLPSGVVVPVPSRRRVPAAYSDLVRLSKDRGLTPCHQRTLRRKIESFSLEQSERARRGRRASYRYAGPVGRLLSTLGVHGERVFEAALIDHWRIDLRCVSGRTGAPLGFAWLTLIIDAFSYMPLGYVVRFDPPSVYSVLCALYDCIVRHGRAPDQVASDQAIEFESPDVTLAFGYCRTVHLRRPASKPRFGAIIERFFGALKTRLIDELSGAVDAVARERELEPDYAPERHALWTLAALSELLERYFFGTYPNLVHSELGTTPAETFAYSLEHSGARAARRIANDDHLHLALSQTVPGRGGTRKVPKEGGPITVGYNRYYHPEFANGKVAGRSVPVRRCAADASFVYVLLPHLSDWEPARLVAGSINLAGLSWRQARALIEERSRQHLLASLPRATLANTEEMSKLLRWADAYEHEALLLRQTIDAEQADESLVRIGDSGPGAQPAGEAVEPERLEALAQASAPFFDLSEVYSYDDDPD